jgi:hypothetical protein
MCIMKILLLATTLALPSLLPAAALKEAEVTRIINDVRLVPAQKSPSAAKVGDKISGQTALATGAQSRAELRFPDQTLTRLGSNSVFRLDSKSRDINLEKGVMLLQVPKQLGGATVRTAAITAAVTGTTVMMEYSPDGFVKIIVLEGEVDVFLNENRSELRTISAGDMLITKPDATALPAPVQVDLQRLRRTSKLLNAKDFSSLGNEKQLQDALQQQNQKKEKGELMETAYLLQGRGTSVTLSSEARLELLNQLTPAQRRQFGYIPGTTQVDGTAQIDTRGIISVNNNSISQGIITALGIPFTPGEDGSYSEFVYGVEPYFTAFDEDFSDFGTWSLFKFDELYIVGTPLINSTSGPRHLVFAGKFDVTLSTNTLPDFPSATATGVLDLDSALDAIAITTLDGDVIIEPGFQIRGSDQSVFLSASGGTANVVIEGPAADEGSSTIAVPYGKLYVYAGTDVSLSNQASVKVEEVRLAAVHDVNIDQSDVRARSLIEMIAQNGISIQNSSSLRALASTESPAILLEAQGAQGDILISQSQLAGDSIRARTLGVDGRLILGNTSIDADQLVHLYAQGSNGQIQFSGNVSIDSPETILAAKKVTIDNGVNVTIQQPAGLDVFTDVPQFNTGGFGNFVDGASSPITFTPGDNFHAFDSPLKPSF